MPTSQQTEIKDPSNLKAEPKKFAFDFSYWSHDGYTEGADGYLSPKSPKYADQVIPNVIFRLIIWASIGLRYFM